MIRVLGFLIGLAFAGVLLISLVVNAAGDRHQKLAGAACRGRVPQGARKALSLSSSTGPFGKFDKRQLQRGFQVYWEVCSACHSLKLVSFRDLKGLGYNDAEIKKIASDWKMRHLDQPRHRRPATRKPLPSDTFPPPFAMKSRRARRTTMRSRQTCR